MQIRQGNCTLLKLVDSKIVQLAPSRLTRHRRLHTRILLSLIRRYSLHVLPSATILHIEGSFALLYLPLLLNDADHDFLVLNLGLQLINSLLRRLYLLLGLLSLCLKLVHLDVMYRVPCMRCLILKLNRLLHLVIGIT